MLAAIENDQFGMIVGDYDVSNFLNRVAVPHIGELDLTEHKEILEGVIEDQKERHDENE
ncbi:MAG: hypothetical protein GY861_08130 [bacterium]|nr:hypothetical protein [bacterium]